MLCNYKILFLKVFILKVLEYVLFSSPFSCQLNHRPSFWRLCLSTPRHVPDSVMVLSCGSSVALSALCNQISVQVELCPCVGGGTEAVVKTHSVWFALKSQSCGNPSFQHRNTVIIMFVVIKQHCRGTQIPVQQCMIYSCMYLLSFRSFTLNSLCGQ